MSVEVMSLVFKCNMPELKTDDGKTVPDSTAKFVLLALADHSNEEGEGAYPGVDRICQKTNFSTSTVCNALNALRHNGFTILEGKSKSDTNNYTISVARIREFQWPKSGDSSHRNPGVSAVETKPSVNHQFNHPLRVDNEKVIQEANLKVDKILEAELDREKGWIGREKMPEPIRDLLDAFVECSGVKPTRGQVNDWFATGSDWLEIGAKKQDILDAFEKSKPNIDLKRTGFTVGRPGSLTTTIQAIVGERRKNNKPQGLKGFMDKYLQEHPNG